MSQADFFFFNELNDFLSPGHKTTHYLSYFRGRQSVKHLIEAQGVPHTEVGMIFVDGHPKENSYIVQDGDHVQVYPILRNEPDASARFILDGHLGKLAAYMRMAGIDTVYRNDFQDEQLAQISNQENRILLTRDIRLLMRRIIQYGYWVRDKNPERQLVEVFQRYHLFNIINPFNRCLHCNGVLRVVEKEKIFHRLQPLTRLYYSEFKICPDCDQIYWKGSHYDKMAGFLERVVSDYAPKNDQQIG